MSGELTGATFGAIRALRVFITEYPVSRIFFIRDAGKPAFRTDILGTYKGSRGEDDDGFYEEYLAQIKSCHKILTHLGLHVLYAPRYEADDVMGALAQSYADIHQSSIIYSCDKDMIQCSGWSNHISVYRPSSDEWHHSCPPWYVLQRAIVGDTSDEISGVKGVGDVYAERVIRAIRDVGWSGMDVQDFYSLLKEHYGDVKKPAYFPKVVSQIQTIRNNMILMDLQYHKSQDCKNHYRFLKGIANRARFDHVCRKLQYREFLQKMDMYFRPFSQVGVDDVR